MTQDQTHHDSGGGEETAHDSGRGMGLVEEPIAKDNEPS